MQNKNLERIFVKQLSINAGADVNHTLRYSNLLRERKRELNKSFNFSEAVIKKLAKLNIVLKEKESEIITKCLEIEENILEQISSKKNSIVDYEIKVELLYYSDTIMAQFKNNEIDYLYNDDTFGIRFVKKGNRDSETCWLGVKAPADFILNHINPCYTFYSLVEYSYLALQDIVTINKIWWDIEVRYQYNKIIT